MRSMLKKKQLLIAVPLSLHLQSWAFSAKVKELSCIAVIVTWRENVGLLGVGLTFDEF